MQDAGPEHRDRSPSSLRSFVLFALVGALGTACQYAVLVALVQFAAIDVVVASMFGAVVGALVNFVLNHHVTFDARSSVYQTGPRYLVLVALSFVNNAVLVYLMFKVMHWNYLVAQIVATGIVFFINYLFSSLWVFKGRKVDAES